MGGKLPPLNPLRVFDVAGRCSSFTEAAEELAVTQAAVSRQIGVLEDYYGVKLFNRDQRCVSLTPVGRRLHREIAPAFEAIQWASAEILREQDVRTVTIQTNPSFAVKWLVPRLQGLLIEHPTLSIHIKTGIWPAEFSTREADILIRIDTPPSGDLTGFPICGERLAPACTASLFEMHGKDVGVLLRRARLIGSKFRLSDWVEWARYSGVSIEESNIMSVDSSHLAYQTAAAGLGVVAAQLSLIASDLERGALILPCATVLDRGTSYWCNWSKTRRRTRTFQLILEWLRSQAEPIMSNGKVAMVARQLSDGARA